MPTLIRFGIVLLVLAALVLGGMIALAVVVHPTQKEIRVRIPARDIGVQTQTGNDPLGIRPTPTVSAEPVPSVAPTATPPAAGDDGAETVDLPAE